MLCDNLEGWDRVGGRFKMEETYVCRWLTHVDVWQKPTQYCKAIILQLKIKKLKKILTITAMFPSTRLSALPHLNPSFQQHREEKVSKPISQVRIQRQRN